MIKQKHSWAIMFRLNHVKIDFWNFWFFQNYFMVFVAIAVNLNCPIRVRSDKLKIEFPVFTRRNLEKIKESWNIKNMPMWRVEIRTIIGHSDHEWSRMITCFKSVVLACSSRVTHRRRRITKLGAAPKSSPEDKFNLSEVFKCEQIFFESLSIWTKTKL